MEAHLVWTRESRRTERVTEGTFLAGGIRGDDSVTGMDSQDKVESKDK